MSNVIEVDFRPKHVDPWAHAQPSYKENGDRFELWSAFYFGISLLIYANGSPSAPEPPHPTGGTPAAANIPVPFQRLKVAA